jgi:Tfp pilus assembly protein PilN
LLRDHPDQRDYIFDELKRKGRALLPFRPAAHHSDQPADRFLPRLWDIVLLHHPLVELRDLVRLQPQHHGLARRGIALARLAFGCRGEPDHHLRNPSHIIVAVEIAKTTLARHRRFLEMLLQAATPPTVEGDE